MLRWSISPGRAALWLAALVFCLAAFTPAGGALASPGTLKGDGNKPADTRPEADQTIPGTPVRVTVRDGGTAGVFYNGTGQFADNYAEGIFIWAGGQVWGPSSVPFGPPVNEYTPVSNTLTGSGTTIAPWRVTNTLNLGSTGLQLVRSVRYVNGDQFTRQDSELRNNSSHLFTISMFHAADLSTGGDPSGYGFYSASNGEIGGYNQPRSFYQLFIPVTGGSLYKEGVWNEIWAAIGNTSGPGPGFDNSYHPDTYEDNGAGLQWNFVLPPGGRYVVSDFHSFTTAPNCAVGFSDVFPTDFYFDAVYYLACNGVISGYADSTFRPGANTTRGQLCKIITLANGWTINTTGGPHFSDVPAGSAFYDYVETAYNRNVISGYADGTFRPGASVTRGQLTKIIVLAQGWPINTAGGPHFYDVPQSYVFYNYIETAYNRNVVSGYSDLTFRPGNPATRGQISKIVYSALQSP